MDAVLKLRYSEHDDASPPEEEPLPVPPWVLRLANRRLRDNVRIGPALVNLLAFVAGSAIRRGDDSITTSVPELMVAFPHVGERTIKRWIEDLRAPVHEDQAPESKYLRLGLLECSKAELEGEFRLTPLRPPDDGPRPAAIKAGPQGRLFEAPQDFAQTPAEAPREFAQSPAVDREGILKSLKDELRRLAGPDRYADWLGEPTEWRMDGARVLAIVPHGSYLHWFRSLFRSVIGPACRTAFPGGETFELLLADSTAPACAGGRDQPQDFAQSPAVLLQVKLSLDSYQTLKGSGKNQLELKVQSCGPQILARAAATAARFTAPPNFYFWHWVQAAWAVETGRVPADALETCITYCLTRNAPHWQFARSVKGCFGRSNVRWLDPREADQRVLLISQLANAGLSWDEAWEGSARRKPR